MANPAPRLSDPNIPLPALPAVDVPPPTIDQLRNRIDPWITYELRRAMLSDPHYENQWYGLVNSYLNAIFPKERNFMVCPQAILRRLMSQEQLANAADGETSFGSDGGLHESRALAGSEADLLYPDFLIVKVIPQPMTSRHREYILLAVIEVKRAKTRSKYARDFDQMSLYLKRLVTLPNLFVVNPAAGCPQGIMLTGSDHQVGLWHIKRPANKPKLHLEGPRSWDDFVDALTPDDPFTTTLCQIASRAWNVIAPNARQR